MVSYTSNAPEEVVRMKEDYSELWDQNLSKEQISAILGGLGFEDIYALLICADLPFQVLETIAQLFQNLSPLELSRKVRGVGLDGTPFVMMVKDLTRFIATHPNVTVEIIASMLESAKIVWDGKPDWVSSQAYKIAAANPILAGEKLKFYVYETAGSSYPSLLPQGLLRNTSMTPELFAEIFKNYGNGVIEYAYPNPSLPREYIEEALSRGSITAIKRLAYNTALTKDDFESIRTHLQKTQDSDRALGLNPALPDEMLFKHSYLNVRRALSHPDVPIEMLTKILLEGGELHLQAAIHPKTPIQAAAPYLHKLFNSNDPRLSNPEIIDARCDTYLKTLGFDDDTLKALPLRMKLEIIT